MVDNNRPIGIFDSGLGGLTVVKQIKKILPYEKIVYFGDTARVPYGSKSSETVIRYSLQISQFLEDNGVKFIVVACNTSSSIALEELKLKCNVPVIGVVEPACKKAVEVTKEGTIGVIGTIATMNSDTYKLMLNNLKPDIKVIQKACPLFVPLIEEGLLNGAIVDSVIDYYLSSLKGKIDTLILGCTHYPLLKDSIKNYFDSKVIIIDSSIEVANEVYRIFKKINLLADHDKDLEIEDRFFVSDYPQKFEEIASFFMGQRLKNIEKVFLE
ncbi:MAG: glutamate racemase [Candidatus Marinimicrobia bacterium]|nr:glutamate racemase [Candidatus Neomarinimicrobiota bacterium]